MTPCEYDYYPGMRRPRSGATPDARRGQTHPAMSGACDPRDSERSACDGRRRLRPALAKINADQRNIERGARRSRRPMNATCATNNAPRAMNNATRATNNATRTMKNTICMTSYE